MKILHTVEFYDPSVGGAQEVVRQLSEHLVRRGHRVTVATTRHPDRTNSESSGVSVEQFEISGNAARGLVGEVERYRDFLRRGDFDVMLNYAAQQWASDAAFELIGQLPYATLLAPCGFSGLYQRPYRAYFESLPAVLRRYDGLVFHGGRYRDIDFARRHGVDGTVIPHGVSTTEFGVPGTGFRARFAIPADEPLVLTVGSHTGLKGHREAVRAFRRARLDHGTLVILGNRVRGGCDRSCRLLATRVNVVDRGRRRILVEEVPRGVVVEALFDADLFVLASRIEASPTVLYESFAAGTPFVSADVGNAAELVESTGAGVVVETAYDGDGYALASIDGLARAIDELIADPARRERMGSAGRSAWKERFTWDAIAAQYEAVYARAIHDRKERRPA